MSGSNGCESQEGATHSQLVSSKGNRANLYQMGKERPCHRMQAPYPHLMVGLESGRTNCDNSLL